MYTLSFTKQTEKKPKALPASRNGKRGCIANSIFRSKEEQAQ
jgi:hypothetical protein